MEKKSSVIRPVRPEDAVRIAEIYNHYVLNTTVTFEEEPVASAEMERRIREYTATHPWLVREEEGTVAAYAYATGWRGRSAYRWSAELTVYVHQAFLRRGMGLGLYGELLPRLKALDFKALVAGIALPNEGSVALHEKLGFKKVAHFEDIGRKFDCWIDVGYWELKLR